MTTPTLTLIFPKTFFIILRRLYKFEICYALVTSFLSVLLTKTSINGILFRGGMHLFSLNQLQEFLEISDEWISHDKMVNVFIKFHFFVSVHFCIQNQVLLWIFSTELFRFRIFKRIAILLNRYFLQLTSV